MSRFTNFIQTGGGGTVSQTGGYDTVKPAFSLSSVATGNLAIPVNQPAFKLTEITITNNGRYGAASQSGSGWTNPGNAVGKQNGTNATVTGSATAATGGTLTLTYAALANKTDLAISAVTLSVYGSQSGTTLNNGNYVVQYSINGGSSWTTLFSQTGNFTNSLNNNINGMVGSNWANLQNFRVRVTAQYSLGELVTATLDAVELNVTASQTTIQ